MIGFHPAPMWFVLALVRHAVLSFCPSLPPPSSLWVDRVRVLDVRTKVGIEGNGETEWSEQRFPRFLLWVPRPREGLLVALPTTDWTL